MIAVVGGSGLIGAVDGAAEVGWPDVVGAITSVGSLLVVVVAAIYAKRQVDDNRATRYAELMLRLSERWAGLQASRMELIRFEHRGPELKTEFAKAYDAAEPKYFLFVEVPNFFEELAIHVFQKTIPFRLVSEWFGGPVRRYWDIWQHAVPVLRESDKATHGNFEQLARMVSNPAGADDAI